MIRKLLVSAAALALTAMPASAGVIVNVGAPILPIPAATNNFFTELTALGFTNFTSTGASLLLTGPSNITFEFLGTESGYFDSFSTTGPGAVNVTESSSGVINSFATPFDFGTQLFAPGNLAGLLNFTSNFGVPATVGDVGFGIFLPAGFVSGSSVTTLYFGYDDQDSGRIGSDDDNHDDLIIRATITAVPEPATWAMMITGFGLTGAALRRRAATRKTALA